MRTKDVVIAVALAVGGYLLYKQVLQTPRQKLTKLLPEIGATAAEQQQMQAIFNQMSDSEVADVWQFISQYKQKNLQLTAADPLYNRILAISSKYNIFT